MKKSNKLLNGFLAFVIVLASLAVVLFLNVTGQIEKYYKENFKPIQSGEQLKDKTADWKVYRNEEYWFEFEYPDNLTIEEKKDSVFNSFSVFLKSNNLNGYILVNNPGVGTGFSIAVSSEDALIDGIKSNLEILDSSVTSERAALVSFNKGKNDFFWLFRFDKSDTDKLSLIKKTFSTFKFTEKDETAKTYILDCTNEPDSFQSKYSWYREFKEQIIENWSLDTVCYNNELNKAVYLKSKIDWENYVYDSSRTSYGFSQLGIYDIEKDAYDKAPEKNLGFYEGCTIIKEWDKNNEIVYQCGAGDAGVGTTRAFSYNTIAKTARLIEECNIQAGREPEKICTKK